MGEQSYSFDVFVSSGEADKILARETMELLRNAGLRVWHQDDVRPTDQIDYYVTDALKRSRVLVQLLSQNTVQSGWQALEERTYSFRDPSNKDRQFVILGIHSMDLPISIAQSPVIDWSEEHRKTNATRLIAICTPPPEKSTARGLHISRSIATKSQPIGLKLVSCTKLLPSTHAAVFGTHEGRVYIAPMNEPKRTLQAKMTHGGPVTAIDTDVTSNLLFSASLDRSIKAWNLSTGEPRGEIHDVGGQVTALRINGSAILAGLKDGQIKVWQTMEDEAPRSLRGHAGQIHAIECRGSQVVSASEDTTVRVWNRLSGQCLRVLEGHVGPVQSLAISPDGRYLASGSADLTVGLWDLTTGQLLNSFDSHTDAIHTCAWHDSGQLLVSAGGDRTPRVWDVETGKLLRILDGNCGEVLTAIFDHDSVWASDAQTLCKWEVTHAKSVGTATDVRITSPSPSQQVQYTNAKVLLVGDSGSGKTGLSKRLACGEWEPSAASTVGAWATQWALPASESESGEREIWLWDFGGQADQRLIHQLYMDETALN